MPFQNGIATKAKDDIISNNISLPTLCQVFHFCFIIASMLYVQNLILSHSLRFSTNESLSPPIPILPHLFWVLFITYIINSYLWGFTCSIILTYDTTAPLIMQKKNHTFFLSASPYITIIPNWIACRYLKLTFKVLDQLAYFSPNLIRIIISIVFFNSSNYHDDSLFYTVCLPKRILLLLIPCHFESLIKCKSTHQMQQILVICLIIKPLNNSPLVKTGNHLRVRLTPSFLLHYSPRTIYSYLKSELFFEKIIKYSKFSF